MLSLFCACTMQAQEQKHSTFYYQRATLFEVLPTSKSDIIFLGNSITNGGEWAELLGNPHAKNRGISGDTTQGVLDRLRELGAGGVRELAGEPENMVFALPRELRLQLVD